MTVFHHKRGLYIARHPFSLHTSQNLKKSWHPSTFHNLEKVWKAEQRHESEQKKIAQLQQELQEERAREEMQRTAIDAGVIKLVATCFLVVARQMALLPALLRLQTEG